MFNRNKKYLQIEAKLSKLSRFGFEEMGNFRPNDVFVIGYPKSGNTLMQFLIAFLVYNLRKDAPLSLINSCVTEYYNNPFYFRHNERHFFKSHELPKAEYKNVIYIVRDGREAVRSYYYMLKNLGKQVNLETLYGTGGNTFVGNWANHLEQWTNNKFNANILFIRYEDLISGKEKEIQNICKYLGLSRSTEEINLVVEATSLKNMKKMEDDFSWQRSKSFRNWQENGIFVREGKKNGFIEDDIIKDEWIRKFETTSKEMLEKFHYL